MKSPERKESRQLADDALATSDGKQVVEKFAGGRHAVVKDGDGGVGTDVHV